MRNPILSKNQNGEPLIEVQTASRTIPIADWICAISEKSQRTLALLQLSADILLDLQTQHASGAVFSKLSDETIHILLPERKAVLRGGSSNKHKLSEAENQPLSLERAIFLAPEQTGVLQRPVGPYTDLYSLGVFLYSTISGEYPIPASNLSELMLGQMTTSVTSLRWKGNAVPRCVDDYVLRLLKREPRDRYQSTKAALADLNSILDWLAGRRTDSIVLGCTDGRERLCEASLVGRDVWLNRFEQALFDYSTPVKRWLILSKSGEGKTRLLDEFAKEAKAYAAPVLRMHGVESENSRPLETFVSLSRDLEEHCKSNPNFARILIDGLSQHEESIRPLLPWLFENKESETNVGPEKFAGQRLKRAVESLLDLLNIQPKRILMLVDNFESIDELSRDLLTGWFQTRRVGHADSLMFIATGLLSSGNQLQSELGQTPEVLQPLTQEDIASILSSMIGEFPPEALHLAANAANGNPFLAISLLQGMIESGSVLFREGAWSIRTGEPLTLQSHVHGSCAQTIRTSGLPEPSITFLTAGAVLGKSFRFREAHLLANIDWNLAQDSLELAVQRQIVWSDSNQRQMGFVHDDVRQFFLDQLSRESISKLHLRAASLIRQEDSKRTYELANHYDAAGCRDEAIEFSLLAAKQSQRQYANDLAIRYYRMAQNWIPVDDRDQLRQTSECIGEVFLSTGDYETAGLAFAESLTFADKPIDRTQLVGRMGDVEFKRGRMSQAAEQYVDALALSGVRVPRNVSQMILGLLLQSVLQSCHSIFGLSRNRKTATPIQRLRWTLFSRLAHTYWFSRGAIWTLYAHLSGMNDAEKYLETPELAKCYSEHAPVCSLLKLFRRADVYSKRSLKIRRDQKDLWGEGQTLAYASVVYLAAADFQSCIETATEGIDLLERTGDAWETNMARYQRANALYRAGRFREAASDAQRIHDSGVEIGDAQVAGISLDVWMRSSPHQVPPDVVVKQAKIHRTDAQSHAQTQLALAIVQIRAGQLCDAESTLRSAIARCKQSGHINTYVSPCYAWLATALRQLASTTPRLQVLLFRNRIARARIGAKTAHRIAKSFPADLPHVLRERALIESLVGKTASSAKLFRKSIKIAEKLHCPMQAWESLKCLSELAQDVKDSRLQLTSAESDRLDWLRQSLSGSIHCIEGSAASQETLSLADRFDTLLADGRRITRSLDKRDIFRESCLASQHLLRGQIVIIISRGESTAKWTVVDKISTGAVTSTQLDGLAQDNSFFGRIGFEGVTKVLPWDERDRFANGSLLATPIRVRDSIAAYLLVGHTELEDLFGIEELKVAEFIATLTGAALENAEGFDELHRLNTTLEQRVEERTAAAELRSTELIVSNEALRATEEQLRDAIEVANAASQAKSRFLATMSHEVRTPLNGILGMTQLALANSPNQQLTNYLSTIQRSGDSLLRLLNDVLDFSKIEAGKMTVESIAFDPNEVFIDAVGLLSIPAWQKGIEVAVYVPPNMPRSIIGDPMKLRQIIFNLMGNAIKFTTKGYVELRAELVFDESPTLRIHVIDTGIGIPEEKQRSIFEAFSQADNSTTRRFGGTGLGLSISTELIRLMNGIIEVTSQANVGSKFTILHPLIIDELQGQASSKPFTRFSGQKFLIVEPCDASRRCLDQTICDYGGFAVSFDSWFDKSDFERPELELFDGVIASGPEANDLLDQTNRLGIPGWLAQGPNATQLADRRYLVKPCIGPDWLDALADGFYTWGLDPIVPSETSKPLSQLTDPKVAANLSCILNILVAEDGLINQCVLVGLLELSGHRATVANNGREAIDLLEKQEFDVCLMDLDMPELDGVGATKLIRSRGIGLPIYAMTAHHDQHHADLCRDAGMNGFLTKPINPNDLQRILATVAEVEESSRSSFH